MIFIERQQFSSTKLYRRHLNVTPGFKNCSRKFYRQITRDSNFQCSVSQIENPLAIFCLSLTNCTNICEQRSIWFQESHRKPQRCFVTSSARILSSVRLSLWRILAAFFQYYQNYRHSFSKNRHFPFELFFKVFRCMCTCVDTQVNQCECLALI